MGDAADSPLAAAAQRLETAAPGYLTRVRTQAGRMAVAATPADQLVDALTAVQERSRISPDPAVESSRASSRLVKRIVRRMVRWYVADVTAQVTEFGGSVAWQGFAFYDYLEQLEVSVAGLRAEVEGLRAQVEQLAATAEPTGP